MEIDLINSNRLHLEILECIKASRVCYDSKHSSDGLRISDKDIKFLKGLVRSGHLSVVEAISLKFHIQGVSRSLLIQHTRHRVASYSVKSTRYTLKKMIKDYKDVKKGELDAFIDKYFYLGFTENGALKNILKYSVINILVSLEIGDLDSMPNDELKYLFSEALKTEYYTTINFRSFLNFYELRSSPRALAEMRSLANSMYETLPTLLKELVDIYMNKEVKNDK